MNISKFTTLLIFLVFVFGSTSIANELVTPQEIVKKYLNIESWEERLDYVLIRSSTKEAMHEHYKYKSVTNFVFANLEIQIAKREFEIQNESYIKALAQWDTNDSNKSSQLYRLKKTPNGWKIDWEGSLGWSEMSLRAFRSKMVEEEVLFRVYAQLSTYYNYDFSHTEREYYSIKITTVDEEIPFPVYFDKRHPDAEYLFKILEDGKWHPITIKTKFTSEMESNSNALMTELVSESWLDPLAQNERGY